MTIDNVLMIVLLLIAAGAAFTFILNRTKEQRKLEKSENLRGIVERFGYCSETPKGWGYWLLKMEQSEKVFKIWPHMHKNHAEIALIQNGDRVDVVFYSNNGELIVSKIKNLSFEN